MQTSRPKFFAEYVAGVMVCADVAAVLTSAILMFAFMPIAASALHFVELLVLAACLTVLLRSNSVKRRLFGNSWYRLVLQAGETWSLISLGMVAWLIGLKGMAVAGALPLLLWCAAILPLMLTGRVMVLLVLNWLQQRGIGVRRVLIIGKGNVVNNIAERARCSPWVGFKVVRRIGIQDTVRIAKLAESTDFDEVWLHVPTEDSCHMPAILHALRHCVADIRVIPDLFTHRMINHGVTFILNVPMVDISGSSLEGVGRTIKQIEDIVLASLILLLISPVMLVIALAVKLTSPGPVIFKQKRHGWGGEEILVYKFRSMKVHQEQEGVVTQAKKNDSRLTPIGGFLRRTSLDELPQFINVLQGRMSIVGPRPHAIQHNHYYKELIPNYMLRHKMKPGITGWAQVNGLRGETETLDKMSKRVDFDLYYLENWTLWLDVKIIIMTLFKGFSGVRAY